MPSTFDDLLEANRAYAAENPILGFDGVAHAGVAVVTCMDSRIDPLQMIGLKPGDAKIFRNPGGRVTDQALEALVLATHLLGVNRVLVIPHTRCAMANSTEAELQRRAGDSAGRAATRHPLHTLHDQGAALRSDVVRVKSHPLVADEVLVGGFIYDVDTGLLTQVD